MRTLLLLVSLVVIGPAAAQEGTVLYEITTRLDIELPPEMQHMADQFPSSRTQNKLLHFDASTSLMVVAPEAEKEDESFESGGMHVMFRQNKDESVLFTDRDAGTSVYQTDFLGRTFLIDDEPEPLAWRLTDEQSEFLGYPCMKATAMWKEQVVEAWFTPEVPVSAGPEKFGGLPGLILVLTLGDAQRTFIAREVTLEPLAEGTIVKPTNGRKVTEDEFQAIMKERLEDMGGGGARIMIRN